jgi:hypothetical protein
MASSIGVQGEASEITAHSADPDTTLTEREFPALPMAQQKFTEALPLIPGVVRTMNGVLNIKGEVANQGMLWWTPRRWSILLRGAFQLVFL